MSDLIPITVVMRSFNDAAILPRTLAALDEQTGVAVTLLVYESGSTDHSLEIIEAHGCDGLEVLEPGTYNSSRVLNAGVARSETDVVAFLNSDAVLMAPGSLRLLADRLLEEETCGGVFARQVPRPDADAMTRLDYSVAFDHRESLGAYQHDMSLVCSMIRKRAWKLEPFDERLTFAEDAVWSRSISAHGFHTRYVPEAAAEHSHNYTASERYRRAYGDAAALAVLPGECVPGTVCFTWARRVLRDAFRVCALGKPHWIFSIPVHRWSQLRGARDGARPGRTHFTGPKADGVQPTV
jgi:rhamnosyltransferase